MADPMSAREISPAESGLSQALRKLFEEDACAAVDALFEALGTPQLGAVASDLAESPVSDIGQLGLAANARRAP